MAIGYDVTTPETSTDLQPKKAAHIHASPGLAKNTLESNRGMFNATVAIAGNRLLLRSNRALYCLGN